MGHTEDADWDGPAQAPQGDPSGQGAQGPSEEPPPLPIHAPQRPAVPGHGLGGPQRPHRAQNLHQARPHRQAREDPDVLPLDLQEHRLPAPAGMGAVQQRLDLGVSQIPHPQPPAAGSFPRILSIPIRLAPSTPRTARPVDLPGGPLNAQAVLEAPGLPGPWPPGPGLPHLHSR